MGESLQEQTCALMDTVDFTSVDGNVIAQLDPNNQNPINKVSLCFPLTAMVFFAGIVPNRGSPISRSVAIRIEPHGRLRVVAGLSAADQKKGWKIRLDGIVYHPYMPFNTVPQCEPACFPRPREGQSALGSAGCVKYCAPTMYDRKTNQLV